MKANAYKNEHQINLKGLEYSMIWKNYRIFLIQLSGMMKSEVSYAPVMPEDDL